MKSSKSWLSAKKALFFRRRIGGLRAYKYYWDYISTEKGLVAKGRAEELSGAIQKCWLPEWNRLKLQLFLEISQKKRERTAAQETKVI